MSYGYPGQGYGPGGGGQNYGAPPPGPPPPNQQGQYGQYNQYGQYSQHCQNPQQPLYGHPPPQQYAPPPNMPQGYNPYGYPQHSHHSQPQPQPLRGQDGGHAAPPPTAPQQFGHGAPQGYTFQYSNCTGRRKALLVGINYFGQKGELRGCINDTKNLSVFLMERYHYKREDMVILTDDQSDGRMQPTRENMVRAMQWLVSGAQPNDSLFFHYSGHGGQTEDLDGDEEDGIDEVVYPVDFKAAGHIVDDEIHHIMVTPLQAGVRLTAIFDSCHSGSVLDLPYMYSTKGVLKEPNLAKEAGMGLLSAVKSYATGDLGGVAREVFGFAKSALKGGSARKRTVETKTSPADVIMWSGSKDDQTSADATIASQATGAMSYAFIKALNENPQQSYISLLNSIRNILQREYSQKPQLSCSHPLGIAG